VSKPIEVFKPRDGETRIVVKDWPDARSPWRVRSTDQRGRELEIEGWSNFRQAVVGRLALHVDGRKPLLVITGYSFEDGLLATEQPEVLGQLVLCARAVAVRLYGCTRTLGSETAAYCGSWRAGRSPRSASTSPSSKPSPDVGG